MHNVKSIPGQSSFELLFFLALHSCYCCSQSSSLTTSFYVQTFSLEIVRLPDINSSTAHTLCMYVRTYVPLLPCAWPPGCPPDGTRPGPSASPAPSSAPSPRGTSSPACCPCETALLCRPWGPGRWEKNYMYVCTCTYVMYMYLFNQLNVAAINRVTL